MSRYYDPNTGTESLDETGTSIDDMPQASRASGSKLTQLRQVNGGRQIRPGRSLSLWIFLHRRLLI